VGRRGRIRAKGGLPLMADSSPAAAVAQLSAAAAQDGEGKSTGKEPARAALLVDVHGLEMRFRNVYTGVLLACNQLLRNELMLSQFEQATEDPVSSPDKDQ